MKTLLSVYWSKEFDDLVHEIGFDMETSEFIDSEDMDEDKDYYGINFLPVDSYTDYMKEAAGLDYFIEYPDLIKKEIIRQTSHPIPNNKIDLYALLNWKEPNDGQFIIVMDYQSHRDYWGEWDESIDVIGVLGVDCEIKEINKNK